MNSHFIFSVLFFILNFKNVFAETTPRVTPKEHTMAFNFEMAKKISEEIKQMHLPDVMIKQHDKPTNVSLSTMKVPRILPKGDLSQIKFKLYTRKNIANAKICEAGPSNLRNCGFNPLKELKIIIHGWMLNSLYESCVAIKNSYLFYLDVNVIVVDWSAVGKNIYYPCVAAQTKAVGWHIGGFINSLINFGCNPKKIHIIGHSLGPHIAAFAAEIAVGKVGRITALDPALPGFVLNTLSQFGGAGRLLPSHADFVDVIHSNGGTLGMLDAVGHVDFYPNGGQIQPGCWVVNFLCSHYRSYDLWDESIGVSKFPAKPCESGSNSLRDILMGEPTPYTARGRYCLYTNNKAPYGIPNTRSVQRSRQMLRNKTSEPNRRTIKYQKSKTSGLIIKSLCVCELIIIIHFLL